MIQADEASVGKDERKGSDDIECVPELISGLKDSLVFWCLQLCDFDLFKRSNLKI